jgi:hypothetical protein
MHEQNVLEFKRRISNYSEEPDKDLWPLIAVHLGQGRSRGKIWTWRLSAFILALSITFLTGLEVSEKRFLNFNHKSSVVESRESISMGPPCSEDRPVPHPRVTTASVDTARQEASDMAPIANSPTIAGIGISRQRERSAPLARWVLELPAIVDMDPFEITEAFDSAMQANAIGKQLEERPQKKEKPQLFPTSFDLYATVTPTLGYQRILSNTSDNIFIESIQPVPAFSKGRLGIRLEVGLETLGSKKWKAFGGVVYFQRHQAFNYRERRVDSLISVPGSSGDPTLEPTFLLVPGSVDYTVRNIGLHFGLSRRLWEKRGSLRESEVELYSERLSGWSKRKFLHEIGGGIELQKSLQNRGLASAAENFWNPSLYALVNVYYRIQYPRTGRLRALLQPTLNYSFYSTRDVNVPFYVRPYGFGLSLGCRYHL